MLTIEPQTRARIAAEVGLHEQYLYQCFTGRRRLPADHCPSIERATAGAVTVEQLRQDVRWVRVPDPSWPHPEGRPCIDVAARSEVNAETCNAL